MEKYKKILSYVFAIFMIMQPLFDIFYLYDDNLTIIYNTQDRTFITRVPTIEQIENSFFENKSVFSEINNLNIGSNLGKDVLPSNLPNGKN